MPSGIADGGRWSSHLDLALFFIAGQKLALNQILEDVRTHGRLPAVWGTTITARLTVIKAAFAAFESERVHPTHYIEVPLQGDGLLQAFMSSHVVRTWDADGQGGLIFQNCPCSQTLALLELPENVTTRLHSGPPLVFRMPP